MQASTKPKLCRTYMVYIYDGEFYTDRAELQDQLINDNEVYDFADWLDSEYTSQEIIDTLANCAESSKLSAEEIYHCFDDEYEEYIWYEMIKLIEKGRLRQIECVGEILANEIKMYVDGHTGEVLYGE